MHLGQNTGYTDMDNRAKIQLNRLLFDVILILMTFVGLAIIAGAESYAIDDTHDWVWPVPDSRVVNEGFSNESGGIFIGGEEGAMVISADRGVVYKVLREDEEQGHWSGYGNGIIIKQDDGAYAHYAHMDSVCVSEGQAVVQGMKIGEMGMTGNTEKVQLYFSMKVGSQATYGGPTGAINNDPELCKYRSYDYWYETKAPFGMYDSAHTYYDYYAQIIFAGNKRLPVVDSETLEIKYIPYTTPEAASDEYKSSFWHIIRNDDDTFRLLNPTYGDRPLEATGTEVGAKVVLGDEYTGSELQKWSFYGRNNGEYVIKNAATALIIECKNGFENPGDECIMREYYDTGRSIFTFNRYSKVQATKLSVDAGTENRVVRFSWNMPAGAVKWCSIEISRLNGEGEFEKYHTMEYVNTVNAGIKLPPGKYRAVEISHSYFNEEPSNEVEFEVIDSKTHECTYEETAVQPTCTARGYTKRHCAVCSDIRYTNYVPAYGHDIAICTAQDDGTHEGACDRCHEIIREKHSYEVSDIMPATFDEDGSRILKCTECGISKAEPIARLSRIKLSETAFIYSGTAKKPDVTVLDVNGDKVPSDNYRVSYPKGNVNAGRHTVRVVFTGDYVGTRDITYTIRPKGTSITRITPARGAMKVKWKRQTAKMSASCVTGYQVRYSRKSSMAGAKSVKVKGYLKNTRKITKLQKGRKYYVQVRTYKVVDNKTVYSKWSSKKAVRIK